ncbi:hypothetical protein YBT020_19635 [Bacillus thuringiensis serovar finitimus YBT-020]|nr:hypothetical protein YBT020_19635 [Bacillus thuringiensis serovar finitimus YBT-020]
MPNNENKVKNLFFKRFFTLFSTYYKGCVERILFIISMLMDYESVKKGNNISRIVAVH